MKEKIYLDPVTIFVYELLGKLPASTITSAVEYSTSGRVHGLDDKRLAKYAYELSEELRSGIDDRMKNDLEHIFDDALKVGVLENVDDGFEQKSQIERANETIDKLVDSGCLTKEEAEELDKTIKEYDRIVKVEETHKKSENKEDTNDIKKMVESAVEASRHTAPIDPTDPNVKTLKMSKSIVHVPRKDVEVKTKSVSMSRDGVKVRSGQKALDRARKGLETLPNTKKILEKVGDEKWAQTKKELDDLTKDLPTPGSIGERNRAELVRIKREILDKESTE